MGKAERISKINAGFLHDQNSWIFLPDWVKIEVSANGKEFTEIGIVENDVIRRKEQAVIKEYGVSFPQQKVKYIRIHAKNIGTCPEWHKGYPNPAWIFVDEVWWE
jgi:hexosaminidase